MATKGLWAEPPGGLPEGFVYVESFLSADEENDLLARIRELDMRPMKMHGVESRRRVAHFGWTYGYESYRVGKGPPIPEFLLPLRDRAAELAGTAAAHLVEALVTEYPPGAPIGWHRDAPPFGIVAAVSLLGHCRLRFRLEEKDLWTTAEIGLPPRSAYLLAGPARTRWQHSIPPVKTLRYSATFRTLRKP